MKIIILVRAGGTAWEDSAAELNGVGDGISSNHQAQSADEKRLQGTLPIPLSDCGREALRKVAVHLRQEGAEAIYSSGNESSGPTAGFLSELCDLKDKKITGMCELNCGLWQGLRIREIKKRYGRAYRQWRNDPLSVCPPEGESVADAFERVKESLRTIIRKNKYKAAAIVAGPMVAAMIECAITNQPLEVFWDIVDSNCAVKKFEMNGAVSLDAAVGRVVTE